MYGRSAVRVSSDTQRAFDRLHGYVEVVNAGDVLARPIGKLLDRMPTPTPPAHPPASHISAASKPKAKPKGVVVPPPELAGVTPPAKARPSSARDIDGSDASPYGVDPDDTIARLTTHIVFTNGIDFMGTGSVMQLQLFL